MDEEKTKHEIEDLIREYADIRIKFEEAKNKYSKHLSGNDNYIGIIGEYWAKRFLEEKYNDKKFNNSSFNGNKSLKWVDFNVDGISINVKTITNENIKKETGKIKFNYKPDGVCAVLVVKLDEYLKPEAILYLDNIDLILGQLREELNKRSNKKRYEWKENKEISFRYYQYGFDQIFKNYITKNPFALIK